MCVDMGACACVGLASCFIPSSRPVAVVARHVTVCPRLLAALASSGDGCSSTCTIEAGFSCVGTPSTQVTSWKWSSDTVSAPGGGAVAIAPPLVPTRWCGGVVAMLGRVYRVGGFASVRKPVASTEAYSPATNTWTAVADAPFAAFCPAVTAVAGVLYAGCGVDSGYGGLSDVGAYNGVLDAWTVLPPLPAGIVGTDCSLAGTSTSRTLYAISSTTFARFVVSGGSGDWDVDLPLPEPKSGRGYHLFQYRGALHALTADVGRVYRYNDAWAAWTFVVSFPPVHTSNNGTAEVDAGAAVFVVQDSLIVSSLLPLGRTMAVNLVTGAGTALSAPPHTWSPPSVVLQPPPHTITQPARPKPYHTRRPMAT